MTLRTPLDRPSVWRREDMAGREDWIRTFSDAELEEIRAALPRRFGAPGFGKADFPLPVLGPRLEEIVDELENGRGFLVMRGLDRLGLDPQGLRDVYWGLARHMGRTISQNSTGALIGEVFDRGLDYDDNNVRGHTTNAEIGPHCDTADVVGLLCVHPAEEGGESLIASSGAIYNEILATAPHLVEALAAGFRIDLAGKGPTGAADEVTRSRIPVFSWYAGRLSCRFNRKQIEDGQRKLGRSLSDEELEAVETVERLALDPRFRLDMDFRAGDIQWLNNHAILHGRAGYRDSADPERRRLLLRLWMNIPNGRPLAPAFADRLNTGPRGGVYAREVRA